jgi:hypothetical protein
MFHQAHLVLARHRTKKNTSLHILVFMYIDKYTILHTAAKVCSGGQVAKLEIELYRQLSPMIDTSLLMTVAPAVPLKLPSKSLK